MRLESTSQKRTGFTLVELLIGAAITVMIMTLLSYCFQTSMQAMGSMRAQGDAADQLRAVGEGLKRDIEADHFLPGDYDPTDPLAPRRTGRKVSDYRYDLAGGTPTNGFFQIVSPPSLWEGNDGFMDSFRSPSAGVLPSLWFTSVLPGVNEQDVYTLSGASSSIANSECAEVQYSLTQQTSLPQTPGGIPLFNLRRQQRLVLRSGQIPNTWPAATPANLPNLGGFSVDMTGLPAAVSYNTMRSLVANAGNVSGRVGMPPPAAAGDDIILSNVISFEIKPVWVARPGPLGFNPRGFGNSTVTTAGNQDVFNALTNPTSADAPFDSLSAFGASNFAFDTLASSTNAGLPQLRIQGVQIRIRIYDPKAKTARQSTFAFDL